MAVDSVGLELFEGNPLPAWLCEPKTFRVLHVNRAAVQAFGHSRVRWRAQTLAQWFETTLDATAKTSVPVTVMSKEHGPMSFDILPGPQIRYDDAKAIMFVACGVPTRGKHEEFGSYRDRLRDAMRFANMGFAELSIATGEVTVSPELFELLEEAKPNAYKQSIEQFVETYVVPEDRWIIYGKIQEGTRNLSRSVHRVTVQFRVRTATGIIKIIEAQGTFYNAGKALGIFRDITRRATAQQEVTLLGAQAERSESELRKLALIVKHTSNAVILTDRDGRITWVNEGFERISEYKLHEVQGRKPGSFLQGPETDAKTLAYMKRCMAQSQSFRTELLNYSKSGRKYWLDIEVMPVRDELGEISGFMAIQSDITVLKTAVHEMLKSQEQLQTIMDNAPLLVFLKDLYGRYTFFNKSFMRYYPGNYNKAVITDYDLFNEQQADRFRASDKHVLTTGATLETEQDVVINGKTESYYTVKFPLCDSDGHPYSVGGISLLITERKQAELELQKSRKALEKQNQVLGIINQAQLQFIRDVEPRIFFETVLRKILVLTGSQFGFIGEVLYEQGIPHLETFSVTDISWNDDVRKQYEDSMQRGLGLEFRKPDTLIGQVLRTSEPLIATDPPNDPRSGGLPDGHPAVTAFLAIPVLKGGRQIGMIGLGNRPEGYTAETIEELQPLINMLGNLIEALGNEQRRKRAEETLRESEQRFRTMADSAPVLIWMSGPDRAFEYFNKGWLDFTGRVPSEEIQYGWFLGIHPEDLKRYRETYETAFTRRERFTVEYRLRRHDGEYRWMIDNGSPRYLLEGEFVGYIGTCMDIHDRKLAGQSIAESESRYRAIVEDQQEMICRYVHDGTLTFVNRAYARTLHREEQELIGKRFTEFIPNENRASIQQYIHGLFDGSITPEPVQQVMQAADGSLHWQEWFDVPLKNDRGEVYEVQSIGHDITRRKMLEAEQARLDKIVRESYNEIFLFNNESLRFEFANASALGNLGYTLEELTRMKFSDLFNYPDEMALQALLRPLRMGETDRLQLQIKYGRKNGSYYDVDTVIQMLEKNKLFVAITTDITQKLGTERKLLASIQEKEILIKEIHHRVKNNLQLISSIIYIKMASIQQQEVKEFLEQTRQKIRSIALIHERLLQSENLDRVEISDYLGRLIYDLQISHSRQDLSLNIRANVEENILGLDTAIYCGLIVNELITNAIKHAFKDRTHGMIEVGFRRENKGYLLTVSDDGISIPETIQPGQSTSFGLQLLDIFIKQLGGTMEIIREKGTKFHMRFHS